MFALSVNIDRLEEIATPCSKLPDIIVLSETSFAAPLPGYNFITENSQMQAGGVGACRKNNLKHLQQCDLQIKMCGCENIWFELLGKRQKIPYILVYKSIHILRQEIASLKVLPAYKSTPQFENILE